MNRKDYKSAAEKLSPNEEWKAETLRRMQQAEMQPVRGNGKKKNKGGLIALAAAAAFALLAPAAWQTAKPETAEFAEPRGGAVLYAMDEPQGAAENGAEKEAAQAPAQQPAPEPEAAANMQTDAALPAANRQIPDLLPVYGLTHTEAGMRAALEHTAEAFGEALTEFRYDETVPQAFAKAGDVQLMMRDQMIRCTGARALTALTKGAQDAAGYYEMLGEKLMPMNAPVPFTENGMEGFYESQAEDPAAAYSLCRILFHVSQPDGTLQEVRFAVMPEKAGEVQTQDVPESVDSVPVQSAEIRYEVQETRLLPVYRLQLENGDTVQCPACAEN